MYCTGIVLVNAANEAIIVAISNQDGQDGFLVIEP